MATESFFEDMVIDTPESIANLEAFAQRGAILEHSGRQNIGPQQMMFAGFMLRRKILSDSLDACQFTRIMYVAKNRKGILNQTMVFI